MKPKKNEVLEHVGYRKLGLGEWSKPCVSFQEASVGLEQVIHDLKIHRGNYGRQFSGLTDDVRRNTRRINELLDYKEKQMSILGEKESYIPNRVSAQELSKATSEIWEAVQRLQKMFTALANHVGVEILSPVDADQSPFDVTPYKCVRKSEGSVKEREKK